jgi:hypothetical protein
MIGTNGAGDFFSLRLDNRPGVWKIGTDCGDEPALIEQSFAEFINVPLEFHHRGYKRGDLMPLTEPIVPQASADSVLERTLLGHWVCAAGESSHGAADVYFNVGRVGFGKPPSGRNLTEEIETIRTNIATNEAWLLEHPTHILSPARRERIEDLQNQLKALEAGKITSTPTGIRFEVLGLSDSENWMRLRYQLDNGYGGDWRLQFEASRDEFTRTRKEYYRENFVEPERWTRVSSASRT